jgi:hypothetical protein
LASPPQIGERPCQKISVVNGWELDVAWMTKHAANALRGMTVINDRPVWHRSTDAADAALVRKQGRNFRIAQPIPTAEVLLSPCDWVGLAPTHASVLAVEAFLAIRVPTQRTGWLLMKGIQRLTLVATRARLGRRFNPAANAEIAKHHVGSTQNLRHRLAMILKLSAVLRLGKMPRV